MRRALLSVTKEAYGAHYDDLDPEQQGRVLELIALRWLENEELEKLRATK